MITKRVLCPERLRHVPHRFSWIDQRLVRDGHIARCGPQALALYLLLVTVADAQGLSYYSDKTAARLLSLNEAQLREARYSLLAAGLIAYESPLYQVLSLEPTSTSEPPVARSGQTLPISAILRQMLETGGAQQQHALAVISYELYCQIQLYYKERGLSFAQIGRELNLDEETVAKWARQKTYCQHLRARRKSKLDPYKPIIQRWLEQHPYSAAQIFQRLRAEQAYSGGISILTDYVRRVRPVRAPAFLTLVFAPGECAQVDWGCAGSMAIGSTRRRLSFFVMVLCYSRLCYVEFSLGEATEHFLAAHQNALEFFGGVPAKILIDNPKTAVLKHPAGERPLFHPRYLDFAAHYGFEPRACNVRRPNEKGRVESGVGYVKKNFLDGLQLPPGLNALNTAARHWMETVANVRIHGETHKQPIELFALEKPHLNALPPLPADTGVIRTVPTSSRFRVVLDTNRYSVPSLYASQPLLLKTFADRLCIYHGEKLIATHTRSYDRHQDFEDPEHGKELLDQRRAARDAKLLLRFFGLCPRAEEYYLQLKIHRLNPRQHIAKIMALSEVHGCDKIARAIEDSFEFQAFSSDYIANILQQRERFSPQPGPLHLTRRQDLLEVELEQPDLSVYESSDTIPIVPKP